MDEAARSRPPSGGPPALVPAIAFGALLVASAVAAAGGPRVSTDAATALLYARTHAGHLQAAGFLAFAAAVPLAVWAATMYGRLRRMGAVAPGPLIGFAGGILAAASLAISGIVTWTLGQAAPALDQGTTRMLVDLSFATGAAGLAVPLALLIAGAAIPAAILHLGSRTISWIGLVIAAVGLLSTFTLLTSALDPTLPVGRFGGMAWIVVASVALPAVPRSEQADPQPAAAR